MGSSFSNETCPEGLCQDWRFVLCFLIYILDCAIHPLAGMHRSNEGCDGLLENTATVLSDEALRMLLVSAQETNIALCVKYAAQQWVIIKIAYP